MLSGLFCSSEVISLCSGYYECTSFNSVVASFLSPSNSFYLGFPTADFSCFIESFVSAPDSFLMASLSPGIAELFQRDCQSFRIFCSSEVISLSGYMSVPRSIQLLAVFSHQVILFIYFSYSEFYSSSYAWFNSCCYHPPGQPPGQSWPFWSRGGEFFK